MDIAEYVKDENNKRQYEFVLKQAEMTLFEKIKNIYRAIELPFYYKEKLPDDEGHTVKGLIRTNGNSEKICVEIAEKYKDEPYVYAHELGHYIAIKLNGDHSEEAADEIGLKICEMLLDKSDYDVIKPELYNEFSKFELDPEKLDIFTPKQLLDFFMYHGAAPIIDKVIEITSEGAE